MKAKNVPNEAELVSDCKVMSGIFSLVPAECTTRELALGEPFTHQQLVREVKNALWAAASARPGAGTHWAVFEEFNTDTDPHPRWGINE